MAEISFYYSVMAAGKSTFALQLNYSLRQAGFKPELMKPAMDVRDVGMVRSRIGLQHECQLIDPTYPLSPNEGTTHIIVDEAQFLTEKTVNEMAYWADVIDIPVYCFGLRTAYTGKLFEGSAALMAIADNIIELPLTYKDGNKATMHLRYIGDAVVFDGNPTIVGDLMGEERYESVSRKKYFETRLKDPTE